MGHPSTGFRRQRKIALDRRTIRVEHPMCQMRVYADAPPTRRLALYIDGVCVYDGFGGFNLRVGDVFRRIEIFGGATSVSSSGLDMDPLVAVAAQALAR